MMKLTSVKLAALCAILSLPAMAKDQSGNPFIKPSERTEAVQDSCDIAVIQQLVEQKLAEIAPKPQENVAVVTEGMTNKERILATGAKLVNQVNGVDVYFDEKQGVFLYDDTTESEDKG